VGFKCIVLVREVWDTRDLVGDFATAEGALNTVRLTTRFQPEDLNALEMALKIKDEHGGAVAALAIGQPQEVDVLRECLYRGADEVIRLPGDPLAFEDVPTRATRIAAAVAKSGGSDLLLCGLDVVEGENAQLGIHVAHLLDLPHANYVDRIESLGDGAVTCVRAIEGGYETVRLPLPCALLVGVALLKEDPRAPRSAKARLKLQHKKTPIPEWGEAELPGVSQSLAPQVVILNHVPVPQRQIQSRRVEGADEKGLASIIEELRGADR